MRRHPNRSAAKRRKATRARCGQTHAHRIARLLVREQQLAAKAAQLRHAIDRALVLARKDAVPHAEVASELAAEREGALRTPRSIGFKLLARTSDSSATSDVSRPGRSYRPP